MTDQRIQPQRLGKLLQRLVDIYSPSGKEGDILDFLKGYLKRRNLPMLIQEWVWSVLEKATRWFQSYKDLKKQE